MSSAPVIYDIAKNGSQILLIYRYPPNKKNFYININKYRLNDKTQIKIIGEKLYVLSISTSITGFKEINFLINTNKYKIIQCPRE